MKEPTPIVTPIRRARRLAHEFLNRHLPWLADEGSIQVVGSPAAGWSLMLRIDGPFNSRSSAEDIAAVLQDDVDRLAGALALADITERGR